MDRVSRPGYPTGQITGSVRSAVKDIAVLVNNFHENNVRMSARIRCLRGSVDRQRKGRVPLLIGMIFMAAGAFAPVAADAQQPEGERLFRQHCAACHSLDAGRNGAGPHLSDMIGRTAGSVQGARYSGAMRDSALVWSAQTLDAFLAAPRQSMPGTRMTIGIPDAGQRAAIIEHLESLTSQQGATP